LAVNIPEQDPQVGHAEPEAIGLRHKDTTEGVDIEAGGIFYEGKADPGVACVARVQDSTTEGVKLVRERGQLRLWHGG
jgi:hypothetical protein